MREQWHVWQETRVAKASILTKFNELATTGKIFAEGAEPQMLFRALRALGFGANGSEKTGSIAKVFRLVKTFAKEEPSAFESGKVLNQLMTAVGKEAPYVDEEMAYTISSTFAIFEAHAARQS